MIVRVAGLPATEINPFGVGLEEELLRKLSGLENELDNARRDLAGWIYSTIPQVDPALRPFFLAVKRDCFNGRRLERHRNASGLAELRKDAGHLFDRVEALECELERELEFFARDFERVRTDHRRQLVGLLDHPGLLRGLALAAPELISNVHRLRKPDANYGRKEKSLETSLLRYVSRAALKLSPYSTLTRLALAETTGQLEHGLRLKGAAWEQRSTLRLKRFLIDQHVDLLMKNSQIRSGLRVVLNNTLEELQPGVWRFLRPGRWTVPPAEGELSYLQDAIVKVRLRGPIVAWLHRELPGRQLVFSGLCSELAEKFPSDDKESISRFLDKLLEIGFVCLLEPWPVNSARAEDGLLEYLAGLELGADPAAVARCLQQVCALEFSFASAREPLETIEQLRESLEELWRYTLAAAGIRREVKSGLFDRGNFYEDVFLSPGAGPGAERSGGGGEKGAILQMSSAEARTVLGHLQPLARLSDLFNGSYDFLHAVQALMRRRWPGQEQVGFLELFHNAQELWDEFVQFQSLKLRKTGKVQWNETFRPQDSAEGQELDRLRTKIWSALESAVDRSPEQTTICSAKLAEAVAEIPAEYPIPDFSAFLQPASAAGDLWVMNRMYEGVGRFGSRFTSIMGEELARPFLAHFVARSVSCPGGEAAELLDLMRIQGDTLNVHAVQTQRVLDNPGEFIDLVPERQVGLKRLFVRLGPAGSLPRIVDDQNRWCLPVHLGGASHKYAPTVIRMLALFGPGELGLVSPWRDSQDRGSLKEWRRLVIGNVVLARRKWGFPPQELRERLSGLADEEAYRMVNSWRLEQGIPSRVFLIEGFLHKFIGLRFKPQFIDFRSPLFLSIFRAALDCDAPILALEEALPTTEMLPRDESGAPWAVEALMDSLAFREVAGPSTEFRQSHDCPAFPSSMPMEENPTEPLLAHI